MVLTSERTSMKMVTSVCCHHVFSKAGLNRLIACFGEAGKGERNHGDPAISAATTSAALQALALFAPSPFFSPPPGLIGPDGLPQNAAGEPWPISYTHPGGYPPYFHYPPGSVPCAEHIQPQQTLNPSESATNPDEPRAMGQLEGAMVAPTSKKSRASKNSKSKSKESKGSGHRS